MRSLEKPIFLFSVSEKTNQTNSKNGGVPWDTAVQGRKRPARAARCEHRRMATGGPGPCLPDQRDATIVGLILAACSMPPATTLR
jgi:hypothetical protein